MDTKMMEASAELNTRKIHTIKEDRISELPQNLREAILGFLPLQDAIRTSILSTKWRHCWTMIPHLIFDNELVHCVMRRFDKLHDPDLRAHEFVTVIDKVLHQHNGPILKIYLKFPADSFPIYGCNNQIIHEYIDQWIPLFSRKGVKQLTLQESTDLEDWRTDDLTLQESTDLEDWRTHDLSSLHLTHLTLLSVWFPYTPAFGRFTCLTNLELVDATSNFGKSIFSCPVLEKLTLIICEGLFPNNFCAPNLKYLIQVYREITSEYSIAGFENLSEYSLMLSGHPMMQTRTSNVAKVLGGVHKIKRFSLAMHTLKYLAAGGSPYRLSKPLSYLETLNISDMNFYDLSEVSFLLCLIRSAPNLCKLHIKADVCAKNKDSQKNLKNYRIDDSEDWAIDHLEIVTFSDFRGLRVELELIRFLLSHSPLLKTMSIHRRGIKRHNELTIPAELLQYFGASSRTQIRRLKHPLPVLYDEFDGHLWVDYDIRDV